MDAINQLIFWLHFMALALAGLPAFGIPLLSARIATADPAARPALGQSIQLFSKLGSVAMGTLLLTGAIMTMTKVGGFGAQGTWFWVKLVLVATLFTVVIVSKKLGARAMAGDAAAGKTAALLSKVSITLMALVVAAAVMAFG